MTTSADRVFVDTNVLLTASTPARPRHTAALDWLNREPGRGVRLFTAGQVLREYLAVATRGPAQNGLGLAPAAALANIAAFRTRLEVLPEDSRSLGRLLELAEQHQLTGKSFHDANLVAVLSTHGLRYLLTENVQDFTRYMPALEVLDLSTAIQGASG